VLIQGSGASVDEALADYVASHRDVLTRLRRFMRGLAHEEASDLAALTVAVRQARALSG
jgi:NAD-specific glutamate dehydrogenase